MDERGRGWRWALWGAGLILWIVLRVTLEHVSFLWTALLLVVVLGAVAPRLVRRWRSRPVPVRRTHPEAVARRNEPLGNFAAVRYRRKWIAMPLIMFLALTVGCAWFSILLATDPAHAAVEWFGVVLFGMGVIFSTWWSFVLVMRLLVRRSGLWIDHEGMVDSTAGVLRRRILWHDIQDLQLRTRSSAATPVSFTYLAVDLADPGNYIGRQEGMRRLALLWRWKAATDPVTVNLAILDIDASTLGALIRRYSHGRVTLDR